MHTAHSPLRASHLDIENMAQDNESNDSSSDDASIASGNSGVSGVSIFFGEFGYLRSKCSKLNVAFAGVQPTKPVY